MAIIADVTIRDWTIRDIEAMSDPYVDSNDKSAAMSEEADSVKPWWTDIVDSEHMDHVIELILEAGATQSADARNDQLTRALNVAAGRSFNELIQALAKTGASKEGALAIAAGRGDMKAIAILVESGVTGDAIETAKRMAWAERQFDAWKFLDNLTAQEAKTAAGPHQPSAGPCPQ